MKHIPALDGLRAVAIIIVIVLHLQTYFGSIFEGRLLLSGGFFGVDLFFVLADS